MTGRYLIASFFVVFSLFLAGFSAPQKVIGIEETPGRPDVSGFTFYDVDNRQRSLADFHGKYVLVNVWATWCTPCIAELPALGGLRRDMADDRFEVIAVALDAGAPAMLLNFFQRHGVQGLDVYMDRNRVALKVLKFTGVPTTILVDPAGREIGRINGYKDWSTPEAKNMIKRHISAD